MPLLDFQSNLTILTMDRNNDNGDNYNGMSTPAELQKKISLIVNEFNQRINAGYAMRAHDDEKIKWKLHEIKGNFKDIRFSDLEPEVIYDGLVTMNTHLTLILRNFELQKKIDAMEAEMEAGHTIGSAR